MEDKITQKIVQALQTVYDPEFPYLDLYNLGLIYDITADEKNKKANITMTLTSPACPVGDMILQNVKDAVQDELGDDRDIEIALTFDPPWSPQKIRDEDIKRMFE